MRKRTALTAVASAAALALAGVTVAARHPNTTTKVTATLNAAQLVPRPRTRNAHGSGVLAGTVLRIGKAGGYFTWRLTFRGLSGPATSVEVHLARRGKAGPFAILLCKQCRSGKHAKSALSPVTAHALMSGGAYVVIATPKHPRGEIRGQIAHGRILKG